MNYLHVNVFTSGIDCSANGVSVTDANNLVVPHPFGNVSESDLVEFGFVALDFIPETHNGKCAHFSPPNPDNRWAMFGGAFIYTNDSRFSKIYGDNPIKLFDRF